MNDLIRNAETINKLLSRYGVKFGIYKNGEFREQLFPFDPIPRIMGNDEFSYLEKGLRQRVDALNCFLSDIYGKKQIVKDRVIPEEFIFSAKGFLVPCDGVTPPKGIYSHISGIDLVQSKDNNWYVLEDNLRVPSGASYPMIARELQRRSAPDAFTKNDVIDNRNYADLLKEVMDHVNTGGINVILSPGRYNAAFFEHSYLAEKTGAVLTTGKDIVCENDNLYYIDYNGKKQRVGAVYRRISDEYLDPMTFYEESVIGIPHIFEAYRKGNAALLNAPGNGVADDKGSYISANGKNVIVIGGGDTGNDCVGTCVRHGAKSITQLEMMPKPPEKRTESNPWPQWPRVCKTDYGQQEAAAVFGSDPRVYQTTVKEFIKNENGDLAAAVLVDLKPEKDEKTGRMMMKPVEGSEHTVEVELVLIAAGFLGSEKYVTEAFGTDTDARTNIASAPGKHSTSIDRVFTAGDAHSGQSLVVRAIRDGRDCAKEVDESLMGYTNL